MVFASDGGEVLTGGFWAGELADETEPFQIQWYRKEGDPEVCGHNQLPLSYEIDQTCGYCKERYKGNEEWLEFKLCDQWFHEACFEK